jgi:hypothetical protein
VFLIFVIAHRELTGSSPAGMPAMEFLLFPVLASLLGASLLWIVVHLGCLWAGVSGRAPSFAAILLGASIVVCLLYSAYCLKGAQYCLTINPHLADEAFRHSFPPGDSPPVSSPYGATGGATSTGFADGSTTSPGSGWMPSGSRPSLVLYAQ